MEKKGLLLKLSEIKGTIGNKINPSIIQDIATTYGLWLKDQGNKVVIGRDTRPNGEFIEKALIKGLNFVGCEIINFGICPTPIIFYIKNKLNVKGGIIISDSNKPVNWNKIKLHIDEDFSYNFELKEEHINQNKNDSRHSDYIQNNQILQDINPISIYINDLFINFNVEKIKSQNNLRVIVDPGAGAGKFATPKILEDLGCEVLVINNELNKYNYFPRELKPIKENLKDLILASWKGNFDVGFAHDCDANKLTVIGDDFQCYFEDIISALIIEHQLKQKDKNDKKFIFFTNLASSLRFEVIAERYNIQVLKSYENQNLMDKMDELVQKDKNYVVFGSEGLCRGPIFPYFNKVQDGIFIAAKLVEILVDSKENLSTLVSDLPKFYSYKEKITLPNNNLDMIIRRLNEELTKEGEIVFQIGNNLRFGHKNDWFVLIYPSNTSIKVRSEAKRDSLARLYCETTTELIKLVISKL